MLDRIPFTKSYGVVMTNKPLPALFLAAISISMAFPADAKTASQIYDLVSKSTVVVRNFNDKGKANSIGSGVVISSGYVVTNCHVIKGASQIKISVQGKDYPASIRYFDSDRDVCSLSVANLQAPAVQVGASSTLKVGAKVYAVGAPRGLELTLSDGIVSSLRKVDGSHYIQTTAAISPGSSGGGLFDGNGALVGLTTFYLTEGQNLNFAVPVEWVNELPGRSSKKTSATFQPVDQWLHKAFELATGEKWIDLVEHCRRWADAQPNDELPWVVLGSAYYKAGQSGKAVDAYKEALRINAEDGSTWGALGTAYVEEGEFAKAGEAFQQTARIYPEDATAWYNLGYCYSVTGKQSTAVEAYLRSLRIDPENAKAWANLGVAYEKTGQFSKSIEAYEQALRVSPKDPLTWYNLGVAYGKVEKYAKSAEAIEQALQLNPRFSDAWFYLGLVYTVSHQRGRVLDAYKGLKKLDPAKAEEFFSKFVAP